MEEWSKEKNEDDTFQRKKRIRKTKQCYQNDICRWKRDIFSVKLKLQEKSFE